MRTTIFSLGGSMIVPGDVNIDFLKEFRKLILDYTGEGNRAVIVAGGGKTSRRYQEAASKITKVTQHDLDMIGIECTRVNAELVRSMFGKEAFEHVVHDPESDIRTEKRIIIGSGWKPGCSSDKDAVLLARNLGADTVVNLSNIDHVYDKDPSKHQDAKPLSSLTWDELIDIIGEEWKPGLNSPFDPVASKLAKEIGLRVVIMDGKDIGNLRAFLSGKDAEGTIIR